MVYTTGHGEKPIGGKLFFLIKIFNFYQKKTTSLQRTPSRTSFEHEGCAEKIYWEKLFFRIYFYRDVGVY